MKCWGRRNAIARITVFLLLAIATFAVGVCAQPATDSSKGLATRTFDRLLSLPDDEIDLAMAVLLISRQGYRDLYHTAFDIEAYRERLDRMAAGLANRLKGKSDPQEVVSTVNHYFFRQLGFTAARTTENPKDLFLNSVLDRRRGHCLSLSVLMICVAQRIGLPLYGVAAPRHFFVRYEDAHFRINIETTERGRSYSDGEYVLAYDVPAGSSFYMASMDKKGVLACFFNNLAAIYGRNGMADEALWAAANAVANHPDFADSYNNLGVAYAQKGLLDRAISECRKALAINSSMAEAHNNLAVAYYLKRDFARALEHFEMARDLGYEVDAGFFERLRRYR